MLKSKITIGITEITRNGEATIKLFSEDQHVDSSEIIKSITN